MSIVLYVDVIIYKVSLCRLVYHYIMKTFRENLRDELDFQGLTVKELALKTGIIKTSLDNYLGSRCVIPPADVAVKIAKALNVSVEYLVTGNTDKDVSKNEDFSILNDLRQVSPQMQKAIKDLVHVAAEQSVNLHTV